MMRIIDGKEVYTELEEVVRPPHTALLVVDLQGDYEKEHGASGVLKSLPPVLAAARHAGVMVIYTRNTYLPHHRSLAPAQLRRLLKSGYDPGTQLAYHLDSSFREVVSSVAPAQSERVIDKMRGSAFVGTELEVVFRSNGIRTIVLCGKATDQCVMATLWDALGKDYYTVVLTDCVSSNRPAGHEAALEQMKTISDIALGADLISIWSK